MFPGRGRCVPVPPPPGPPSPDFPGLIRRFFSAVSGHRGREGSPEVPCASPAWTHPRAPPTACAPSVSAPSACAPVRVRPLRLRPLRVRPRPRAPPSPRPVPVRVRPHPPALPPSAAVRPRAPPSPRPAPVRVHPVWGVGHGCCAPGDSRVTQSPRFAQGSPRRRAFSGWGRRCKDW